MILSIKSLMRTRKRFSIKEKQFGTLILKRLSFCIILKLPEAEIMKND